MARIPNPSLLMMMNNNEVHPVELLLIGGLAVVEAVMVLAVALAALVLTVARWRPAPLEPAVEHSAPMAPLPAVEHSAPMAPLPPVEHSAPAPLPPAPPAVPLLTTLAGDAAAAMAPLNVAELRRQARAAGLPPALTRNGRRDALLMALAGLEVACC